MKQVKLKKKRKFKFRILIYAFICFCGYQLTYNTIMHIKLAKSNEDFIKCLLVDSNYHMLYEKKANNLFNKLFSNFFNINEPVSILENVFHFKGNNTNSESGYIKNEITDTAVSKLEIEPTLYIYNTHQSEKYKGEALKNYNITPGVMMATYLLQEKLASQNIKALILEDNLIDYMNLNNMKHSQSYVASRKFIIDPIKNTSSLKLIIDLHRDSVSKEKATTTINNKECAKIAFVIGNEYDNYEHNLSLTNKLNNSIKDKYPSLTRGVIIKGGKGSNGVYNQDLNPKMTLIELGTDSSTIDEVLNTIELLVPILGEFINEA